MIYKILNIYNNDIETLIKQENININSTVAKIRKFTLKNYFNVQILKP